MRPNVLCVVLDTARADALEPYGAPRGSTPALADLARRGHVLPQAYATACWTLPSHISMLSGGLPRSLGLGQAPDRSPQSARPLVEAQRERLLAEVLRRAGYATGAISSNLWISRYSGFDVGFERFAEVWSERQSDLHVEGWRGRLNWARRAYHAKEDDGAGRAGAILRSWLDERGRESSPKPFFWFVNLLECHSPYLPPRAYNELSALQRMRAGAEARSHLTLGDIWRVCVSDQRVPEGALRRMRRLYAGEVRLLDDWMADAMEALDSAGTLDETLVIVTSDHGENLGEGGLIGHAFSLDQRLINVPLIAAGPGAPEQTSALSLAELPRIVADAVGLESHPWNEAVAGSGVAAAQWDPPAPRTDPRNREAMRLWNLEDEAVFDRLTSPLTAATDGRLKLVRSDSGDVLYDLEADPLEVSPQPVSGTPDGEVAKLRSALDDPALWATPAEQPPSGAQKDVAPDEAAEIEERMRILGYM